MSMAYVNNFGLSGYEDDCCDYGDVYIDDYDAEYGAEDFNLMCFDHGEDADEFGGNNYEATVLAGSSARLHVGQGEINKQENTVMESFVPRETALGAEVGNSSLPALNTSTFWNMVKDSCENRRMNLREESVERSVHGSLVEHPRSVHRELSSTQSQGARVAAWAEDGPHFPRHGGDRLSRQASACASLTGSDVVADSGEGLAEALDDMLQDSLTLSLTSQHSNDDNKKGVCGDRQFSKNQIVTSGVQNISKSSSGIREDVFHSEAERSCAMGSVDGIQSKYQTTEFQYQNRLIGADASARAPNEGVYAPTPQVNPPDVHPLSVQVPSSPAKFAGHSSVVVDKYTSDSDNDDDEDDDNDDEGNDDETEQDDSKQYIQGVCSAAAVVNIAATKMQPRELFSVVQHCVPPAIIDQTQCEIKIDFEVFVPTQAFDDALDMIKDGNGKVFLVGPPGSGKQTVARAVMRNLEDKGYSCMIVKTAKLWETHVTRGNRQVLLLQHLFGEYSFNNKHFERWEKHLDMMSECCRSQNMVLIFTVCPHIFQELNSRKCTFFDHQACVCIGKPTIDQKREILVRHLKSKRKHVKEFENRISQIICHDESGELFVGCCRRWVENLDDVAIDEIFQHPSVMYYDFFWRLMKLDCSKKVELVASFCLLLKGINMDDISDGSIISKQCEQLGFPKLSRCILRNILKQFVGVLVNREIRSFANRHAYNGVALAIGRDDPAVLIQVVDWKFLVQRCNVPPAGEKPSHRPQWPRDLIIERVGSDENAAKRTRQTAYCQLVRRLFSGLENSEEMVKACQHRALQAFQFAEDLKKMATDNQLVKILHNTDRIHGQTLLYWSVWNSSAFLTKWVFKTVLIKKYKNMQTQSIKGLTAAVILCCVLEGKRDCLEMLLKYWKTSTGDGPETLLQGCYSLGGGTGSDSIVNLPLPGEEDCLNESWKRHLDLLRAFGADCEHLHQLPGGKCIEINEAMPCMPSVEVKRSVSVSLPLLHIAAMCNNIETVNLLMEKYPAILEVKDSMGRSPLHVSAFFGYTEIVNKFLQVGITFSESSIGNTPLHEACCNGKENVVQLFLSDAGIGASRFINATNEYGETPLFLAVASGNMGLVHLLLQHGAEEDARFRDMSGNSLLHAACGAAGNSELVARYLRTTPVDVHAMNHSCNTPLHVACHYHDDHIIINLLTQHGADVNVPNKRFSTPLHIAAKARHMKNLEALMDSEANINLRDEDRKRAYHYLPRKERDSIKQNSMIRVSASD